MSCWPWHSPPHRRGTATPGDENRHLQACYFMCSLSLSLPLNWCAKKNPRQKDKKHNNVLWYCPDLRSNFIIEKSPLLPSSSTQLIITIYTRKCVGNCFATHTQLYVCPACDCAEKKHMEMVMNVGAMLEGLSKAKPGDTPAVVAVEDEHPQTHFKR